MKKLIHISSLSIEDKETFQSALTLHKLNKLSRLEDIYKGLLNRYPNQPDILNLYAMLLMQKKKYKESKEVYLLLETLVNNNPSILNNIGILYKNTYDYDFALKYFNKTLEVKKNFTDAIINKINILILKDLLNEAFEFVTEKLNEDKSNPIILNLKSIILIKLEKYNEAKQVLNSILELDENFIEAKVNLGILELKSKNLNMAEKIFSNIIDQHPKNVNALNHISVTYIEKKNIELAKSSIAKVISIDPYNIQAINNLGTIYMLQKNFKKSLENFNKVLELNNNYSEALINKFKSLIELRRHEDADNFCSINNLKKLSNNYFFGEIFKFNNSICNWDYYQKDILHIERQIKNDHFICTPHTILNFCDNQELMFKSAKLLNSKRKEKKFIFEKNLKPFENKKIKIAYFSSDFFNHATEVLIGDIFKFHDRQKFEVIAISFSDQLKKKDEKIISEFDKFFDIHLMSDNEVSNLIASLKIDIAIDLNGHTKSARTHYFLNRIAPVQINFLGFAGSMATHKYDYIIADKVLIDKKNINYFSEKIIYFPGTYQPNKEIDFQKKKINRANYNIPSNEKIIFGSFNDNYKITPDIFKIWMEISKEIKGSVFWILTTNELAKRNLIKFAKNLNVDKDKFIFAEKLSYEEHIERLSHADIFLDTFPCNAHTGTSDCFKANVPIVTIKGKSFHSRVAASLLTEINMDELIVDNHNDYKNLIIKLAKDKKYLEEVKIKLKKNVTKSQVYDPKVFALKLDKIFLRIYENYKRGIFENINFN